MIGRKLTLSVRSEASDFHVGGEVQASARHVRSTPKANVSTVLALLS
jgi:hypothetical protein